MRCLPPFAANIRRKAAMFLVATTVSMVLAVQPAPIFDAHRHGNIEAREPYPPAKVLEIFRKNNVRGILGNSRRTKAPPSVG